MGGERVTARPGVVAYCPLCGEKLVPKCGAVVHWHFAHRTKDCDPWREGESEWHLAWKEKFPPLRREIVVSRGGVKHIADVRLDSGYVLEFQHSTISFDDVMARNDFWGKVLWVFDARGVVESGRFAMTPESNYMKFRWKLPRKTIVPVIEKTDRRDVRVLLDFGDGRLFEIRNIWKGPKRTYGWGYFQPMSLFDNLR
ncbi:MAG: hypothetical protein M0R66_03960 [Candidatus Omnitrophica bacterium]|nr:hypothetical protein [Candidatus Omnitrophota bacterium]